MVSTSVRSDKGPAAEADPGAGNRSRWRAEDEAEAPVGHGLVLKVLLTGLMGLLLGGIYLLAGRKIWLGVLVHGLVNTISLTSIYLGVTPG